MKRRLFLILCIIISGQVALATDQDASLLLQNQSKQIEELKAKIQLLEKTVEQLKIDVKGNGSLKTTDSSAVEAPSEATLDSGDANDAGDKAEYDLALATLKDGKFEAAEKQFADFIAKYPSSKLQSNATFWYAESFYRRDMFNKAAINYLQSYKQHPKGSKAPDSLLKLSYSLASLNKKKEACSMLEKLEQEFPERSISSIKRTEEAKNKFQCK